MPNTRFPSVYVDRVGRQLGLWSQYSISDSRALKLLRLWLGYGLTHLMDKEGRYTFHNFNQLRLQLGYSSITQMLDDIRRSHSFVLLSCDIDPATLRESNIFAASRPSREFTDRLTAFYSPLWRKRKDSDGDALDGSIPECQKKCQNSDDINSNALDSNIPSGGLAGANAADVSAAGEVGCDTADAPATVADIEEAARIEVEQKTAQAKVYFQSLVHSTDIKQREPITYLLNWLQCPEHPRKGQRKGYGLMEEEAIEVVDMLIDLELAPHFARDKNFNKPSAVAKPETRIYQVSLYIKNYSKSMVERTVQKWHKRKEHRRQRDLRHHQEAIRRNRPISPHEWQDPEGQRWMTDDKGNALMIAADAPPRPSEKAIWNYIDKKWME